MSAEVRGKVGKRRNGMLSRSSVELMVLLDNG